MVLPYINMNLPQVYTCSPSWTLLPPHSSYHPSGSSQCTSPKQPVSCIEPGLATRFIYDITHVSMPFSQVIPPSSLPESKRLFYTSASLFFFFQIQYFFNIILFLNFTVLYWLCQISKRIRHRYTCVPHPEPSSLLTPHTIPLGRPSAPAPSIQYRASNLDWRLVSYMIVYMFQCHSPKSSHPLPLPQSP